MRSLEDRKKERERYLRVWNKKNKDKINAKAKRWRERNKHKVAAFAAVRRAAIGQATPAWLTKEDKSLIYDLYKESERLSKETGIKHSVDHIVPLRGKEVSGLHVPWNLQIMILIDNVKKKNKHASPTS